MEKKLYWFGQDKEMDFSQLPVIFECARNFSVTVMEHEKPYCNHLNDLIIQQDLGRIYMIDEDIVLYAYNGNRVMICAPSDFEGYKIWGQNFFMEVYE